MSSNIPKQLSHFTNAEAALSIPENLRSTHQKLQAVVMFFEIDHSLAKGQFHFYTKFQ